MRYLPQLLSSVPVELIRDMRDCIPLRVAELLVIVIAAVLVAAIAAAAQRGADRATRSDADRSP